MDAGNLSIYVKFKLFINGFSLFPLYECKDDLSAFSEALANAVEHNVYGAFVDKHSPEELRESGVTAFLSEDNMAGIAVWPDGNIGAVFRDERSRYKKATGRLMMTALQAGGTKLDCYDGFLRSLYAKFGFVPVARVRFNKKYAPKNWKSAFKEPDIIFWKHCGEPVETVARNIGKYRAYQKDYIDQLPCFDDYSEAWKYRDKLLEKKQRLPVTT